MASQAITIGTESISGSLQGVELRTFGQVYQGMMPKIRPLNSNILVVGGRRVDNLPVYDENLTTAIGTERVEEFPNFEREELSFGVPKDFREEEAYQDIDKFNPISFIQENVTRLVNAKILVNLTSNELDTYSGVIEPLTIRSRASRNSIDWPYESHDVRGALSNAAEDVRRRGNLIVDYVYPIDRSVEPYLDEMFEQDTLGLPQPGFLSDPSDLSPPFEDGTDWEDQQNYFLGNILKNYYLNQSLTDWSPSTVVYYVISQNNLVMHDFRNLVVMHLNFEETAAAGDTVVDKTGNGHDGVLQNAATVTLSDYPGYITNRGSLDITTNATTVIDAMVVNHDSTLQASTSSAFSMSFWVKFDTVVGTQFVVAKIGGVNRSEYLVQFSSNRLTFRINDTSSTNYANNYIQAQTSNTLTTATWYHVVVTYNGGTAPASALKIYVNGTYNVSLTSTSGTFTTPKNSSYNLYIGGPDIGSALDMLGKIASFEFYNVELSSGQARVLYDLQNIDQSGAYIGNYMATLGQTSTEQFFPRGSISARSGQFVNLEDSPGTDSIAYAGMKR